MNRTVSKLVNVSLALVCVTLMLAAAEVVLRYRESRPARADVEHGQGTDIQKLFARTSSDRIGVRFFNGCFMSREIMAEDPVLGYKNIPGVDGYSIRVYGSHNAVVPRSFDVSVYARQGLRAEIAPFHINNVGNRGADMAPAKPVATRRIVFLGDSITFGFYVNEDDTFVHLVGEELSRLAPDGRAAEVINAGVSSLNARQICAHLKERALSWSPDLILWDFYVNDIVDFGHEEADVLFPVRNLGALSVLRASALGRFVGNYMFSSALGSALGIDRQNPTNQAVEKAWKKAESDLVGTHKLLQERNIPLVVVIFPSAVELGRPWTWPHYQGRLKMLCGRHHIPCIDILPAFKKNRRSGALYYRGDTIHPNARGHAIAASEIVAFFRKNPHFKEWLAGNSGLED